MTLLSGETSCHEGHARAPCMRRAPHARLLTGAALLGVCLLVRPTRAAGAFVALAAVVTTFGLMRPPPRLVGAALGFGAILGLSLLALVWFETTPSEVAWTLLWRSTTSTLVSLSTAASLPPRDVGAALAPLPLPRTAVLLVTQIVHQTGTLARETRAIAEALAVRGAARRGRSGVSIARALPSVWLVRVLLRAERVAAAMELRGYPGRVLAQGRPTNRIDAVWMLAAAFAWTLVVALRCRGVL